MQTHAFTDSTYEALRVKLTDLDCEACGGQFFQLSERSNPSPEVGSPITLSCTACGEVLTHPRYSEYLAPNSEAGAVSGFAILCTVVLIVVALALGAVIWEAAHGQYIPLVAFVVSSIVSALRCRAIMTK